MDDAIERKRIAFYDLVGPQRLTALSKDIIGIDGVCYRTIDGALLEILPDELIEMECVIAITYIDRVVEFRETFDPPLAWPWYFAVDELTSNVVVEVGWRRVTPWSMWPQRRLKLPGDKTEIYVVVEIAGWYFKHNHKGYASPLITSNREEALKDP